MLPNLEKKKKKKKKKKRKKKLAEKKKGGINFLETALNICAFQVSSIMLADSKSTIETLIRMFLIRHIFHLLVFLLLT